MGLIGEGKAEYKGEVITASEAMEKAGITPVVLAAKEGLALNNGTQMMTAVGVNVLWDCLLYTSKTPILKTWTDGVRIYSNADRKRCSLTPTMNL